MDGAGRLVLCNRGFLDLYGFPEAPRERVFARFFTTKPDGVGLALFRTVVSAHGRSNRAEAPPGGAALVVRQPLTKLAQCGDATAALAGAAADWRFRDEDDADENRGRG